MSDKVLNCKFSYGLNIFRFFTIHPLLKIFRGSLWDLPAPSSLSYWWNFGSLSSVFLGIQILTGIFLAVNFNGSSILAFERVSVLMRDVGDGFLIRVVHSNGARAFFICLYLHIGRGIYYRSFRFHEVWGVGVIILFATMAAAFIGYVLPWGQMSF